MKPLCRNTSSGFSSIQFVRICRALLIPTGSSRVFRLCFSLSRGFLLSAPPFKRIPPLFHKARRLQSIQQQIQMQQKNNNRALHYSTWKTAATSDAGTGKLVECVRAPFCKPMERIFELEYNRNFMRLKVLASFVVYVVCMCWTWENSRAFIIMAVMHIVSIFFAIHLPCLGYYVPFLFRLTNALNSI